MSKYKEIFKLKEMLEKAEIPYIFFDRFEENRKLMKNNEYLNEYLKDKGYYQILLFDDFREVMERYNTYKAFDNEKIIILDTFVEVVIGSRNKQFYINKGYKCNINDTITIPINDLSEKSRIKIKVKCPMCGKERSVEYRQIAKSKHTYCNQCASHIFNYKDYRCDYCGEKSHATINGIHYCSKHYNNSSFRNLNIRIAWPSNYKDSITKSRRN